MKRKDLEVKQPVKNDLYHEGYYLFWLVVMAILFSVLVIFVAYLYVQRI